MNKHAMFFDNCFIPQKSHKNHGRTVKLNMRFEGVWNLLSFRSPYYKVITHLFGHLMVGTMTSLHMSLHLILGWPQPARARYPHICRQPALILSCLKWPAKTRKTSKINFRLWNVVTSCLYKWTVFGGQHLVWCSVLRNTWSTDSSTSI